MTGHRYGYARVSTREQSLDAQLDALRTAGCARIFTDQASGIRADRPALAQLRELLLPGDVLVVTKLDRLGRDALHLTETVTASPAPASGSTAWPRPSTPPARPGS